MANEIIKDCGFHHIALRTTNLKKSIEFYTKGLGFSVFASWGEGENKIVMLDMGNGNIVELFGNGANDEKSEMTAGGYFHLALKTTDVDSAFQAAVNAGAKSKVDPKDVDIAANPVMKVRIAFVYGPDGEIIEFFQTR